MDEERCGGGRTGDDGTPPPRLAAATGKKVTAKTCKGKAPKPGASQWVSRGALPLRRVKGGLRPFSSVPCGVWGNAPTVPRVTIPKKKTTKGAGSEASLPVTSRFLRSAPKLLFPTPMLCRARLARPCSWSFKHSWSFPQARVSPLRRRQKGNGNGRSS